jgi:hypothetical protein
MRRNFVLQIFVGYANSSWDFFGDAQTTAVINGRCSPVAIVFVSN